MAKKILIAILLATMTLAILTAWQAADTKNVRAIEAQAINIETMRDTTGSEWYNDGIATGETVLLIFDSQGTATMTDDIILEVRTVK